MDLQASLKISGHITLKLFGPDGSLKEKRSVHNVIVTAGKNFLAAWLAAATQADYFMRYLAIGTGTTGAQVSNTTLETEVGTRGAGTLSSSNNIWTNQVTFAAGNGTGAITEAGVFSASTSGTLFARQTFAVINKAAGDELQVTWNITLS